MLAQSLIEAIATALLHFLWQGALLALVLAAMLRTLRGRDVRLRYAACCVCLLAMLATPLVVAQRAFLGVETRSGDRRSEDARQGGAAVAAVAGGVVPQAPRWIAMSESAKPIAIALWIAGVLLLSARLIAGWSLLAWRMRRATIALSGEWKERAARAVARMRVRRRVRLLRCDWLQSPALVGWIRPAILVPASVLTGMPADQLETLILHELAHLRRHDSLVNAMQAITEIVLFYHPAVWWASARMREEREYCCDDLVVGVTGASRAYARALLTLEELRAADELLVAATGGAFRARIERILSIPTSRAHEVPAWAVLAAASALFLVPPIVAVPARVSASPARPSTIAASPDATAVSVPVRPSAVDRLVPRATTPAIAVERRAQPLLRGTWSVSDEGEGRVNVSHRALRPRDGVSFHDSVTIDRALLVRKEAEMELRRPAGTIVYSDSTNFEFFPSEAFVRFLAARRLAPRADELFGLAVHGVDEHLVTTAESFGFEPAIDDLFALRIHEMTPELMLAVRAASPDITLDQMISLGVAKVQLADIQGLRSEGWDRVPFDVLIEAARK
jgi:beta-lactamase regulating signal transducer with metallopeptidase domain